MPHRAIGRRIQQAREESGLSQEELAAKLGITQSALSNYERGKRKLCCATMIQISNVLDKPLSYFAGHTAGNQRADQAFQLLEDNRLREILLVAAELPAEDREAILQYIKYRRNLLFADIASIAEVWHPSSLP